MAYIGAGISRFNTADELTVTGDAQIDTTTLVVDSTNNRVGIGTSSPSKTLDVDGQLRIRNGGATGYGLLEYGASATATNNWHVGTEGDGSFRFYNGNFGAGSERLRITSDGKVGVGEASPLGTVHIRTSDASITSVNANADDLVLENNGNCGMSICSSTSGEGNINFIDSGDTNIGRIQYTHSGNNMIFRTDDAERMRLDSGGRLFVNQTTAPLGAKMHIKYSGSTEQGLVLENSVNNSSGAAIRFLDHTNAFTGGGIYFSDSNSINYATSSDARLKENVADMTGAITRVKALAPKRFNFITNPNITVDGFLAHEAQTVVPEAVVGTENGVDNDGNPMYQAMDTSRLVPLLTAALQEAIAKIETLETENSTQATQIADLITRVTALEGE